MPPPNTAMTQFGSGGQYGPLPSPMQLNFGQYAGQQGPNPGPAPQFNTPSGLMTSGALQGYNQAYDQWKQKWQASQPPSLMNQIAQAGFSDATRMQDAANFQWGRNNEQISGFNDFMQQQIPLFQQYAGQQADELHGIADGLNQGAGADLEAFDKFRDKTLEEMQQGINSSVTTAQNAANEFKGAIDDYRGVGFHDAQIAAAGIRESFNQEMQMINAGLRPDGTKMTTGEQMAAKQQAMEAGTRSAAAAAQPMITRVNENLLQANSRLADLRNITSGLQMQGAALGAGTATSFSGQRVELTAQSNAMKQFAASLNATASGLASAAQLNAVQFEMQGRELMAQLVQQNPMTVVGMMPIFAQLMAMGSAPGAGKMPGFNFGTNV